MKYLVNVNSNDYDYTPSHIALVELSPEVVTELKEAREQLLLLQQKNSNIISLELKLNLANFIEDSVDIFLEEPTLITEVKEEYKKYINTRYVSIMLDDEGFYCVAYEKHTGTRLTTDYITL